MTDTMRGRVNGFENMATVAEMEVMIEAVVETDEECLVTFSVAHESNWGVTKDSKLGGKPIRPWLSQPRSLDDDGNPRFDVFTVSPTSKGDGSAFRAGNIQTLSVNPNPDEI